MHFLLFTHIQLIDFRSMFLFRPFQQETDKKSQPYAYQYEIKNLGSRAPIKRRVDDYFQTCFLIAPNPVIISSFHFKGVSSRRQIGISGFIL